MIDLQLSDEKRWEALKKYRELVKPHVKNRIRKACITKTKKPELGALGLFCHLTKDELISWCLDNKHNEAKEYIDKMSENLKDNDIDTLDILLGGDFAVMQAVIAWFQEQREFQKPGNLKEAFDYETMRQNECFIEMMADFCNDTLKVRVCPYCNRNWVSVPHGKKMFLPFEIDHFFPKSRYPYLALSLFNLIPVCHYCNMMKSFKNTNKSEWQWYPYETAHRGDVEFQLNLEKESDVWGIPFRRLSETERSSLLKIDTKQTKPYRQLRLDRLYQTHAEEVQEIVFRILQYQKSYWDMIPWIPTETEEETQESAKDEAYTEYKWKERELLLLDDNWESRVRRTPLGKLKHDLGMQLLGTEE